MPNPRNTNHLNLFTNLYIPPSIKYEVFLKGILIFDLIKNLNNKIHTSKKQNNN